MPDPITEELFRNAISAVGDEMVLTIYRTAYSGVLKNIMDYSAALCDAEGRLVAQGLSLPGHLCSIPVSLKAVLALNHPLIFSRVIPIGWGRIPSSHYPDSG